MHLFAVREVEVNRRARARTRGEMRAHLKLCALWMGSVRWAFPIMRGRDAHPRWHDGHPARELSPIARPEQTIQVSPAPTSAERPCHLARAVSPQVCYLQGLRSQHLADDLLLLLAVTS